MTSLAVGFYQIATLLHRVYAITLPDELRPLLVLLHSIVTLNLGHISVPLTCFGMGGHRGALVFWAVSPAVLVLSIWLRFLVWHRHHQKRASRRGANYNLDERSAHQPSAVRSSTRATRVPLALWKTASISATWWAMWLLFLIYPSVANVAFETFSCYSFGADEYAYLIADPSVICQSAEHTALQGAAFVVIAIYPSAHDEGGRTSKASCVCMPPPAVDQYAPRVFVLLPEQSGR